MTVLSTYAAAPNDDLAVDAAGGERLTSGFGAAVHRQLTDGVLVDRLQVGDVILG